MLVSCKMADKEDIWKSRYYLVLRIYMTILGVWPYSGLCDRYMHFIPMFIFCSSILIPQLRFALTASDINEILESMSSALISLILSLKIASIMFNKNIKSCLKIIEEDWQSLNTDVEKSILQRYAAYGQYLTTCFTVFMNILVMIFSKPVILTFLETDDNINSTMSKLPYHVKYDVDMNRYFYPIMIHCYLALISHAISIITVESLYCTLIQHACGMFSIIGHILEEISKKNDNFHPILSKTKDNNYKTALNCLRRHLQVIKFAKLIESTFTQIFLMSINLHIIVGSLITVQIVMNLNKGVIDESLVVYIGQFLNIFVDCWQAQFLLDYSIVPYESICRGKWYYTSERCKKIFLLIMIRTTIPCTITAGKIITLSIETFGMILKTMMSYFTILRSM